MAWPLTRSSTNAPEHHTDLTAMLKEAPVPRPSKGNPAPAQGSRGRGQVGSIK